MIRAHVSTIQDKGYHIACCTTAYSITILSRLNMYHYSKDNLFDICSYMFHQSTAKKWSTTIWHWQVVSLSTHLGLHCVLSKKSKTMICVRIYLCTYDWYARYAYECHIMYWYYHVIPFAIACVKPFIYMLFVIGLEYCMPTTFLNYRTVFSEGKHAAEVATITAHISWSSEHDYDYTTWWFFNREPLKMDGLLL